jgi:magnesium transporter
MSMEIENAREQFLNLISREEVLPVREFLNDQNISEVAELISANFPSMPARSSAT